MKTILGIELGSTRIKAVLIDENAKTLAQGVYDWENELVNGLWSYPLEKVSEGLRASYADLIKNYGQPLKKVDAIGISAMMHGYLAFDKNGELLTPFRTWRNTNTELAATELSQKLRFNMPQRWSASHYYQAVLNGEAHVNEVDYLTTLAGYVHWKLTGKKVLGVGDASGMFPIENGTYNQAMLAKYNQLLTKLGVEKKLENLLPQVLSAGEPAGNLTESGARFLDPTGVLAAGVPLCPPEGDAGTGMVATNSVRKKTGNVSAGTSTFVMLVLEKALRKAYPEIDVVTIPDGKPVAMVHANNCTSEINAWANLFSEVIALSGNTLTKGELFERLFNASKESDCQTGKLFACNFLSGEPIVGVQEGRPLLLRVPDGNMNLANFMQAQIYSAVVPLHFGMEILKEENIEIESICGHGGFFKTEFVGQAAMSAALNAPVTVMKNAGEGGSYGIALLALYRLQNTLPLEDFLDKIFASAEKTTVSATNEEKEKFDRFTARYKMGLAVEKTASQVL